MPFAMPMAGASFLFASDRFEVRRYEGMTDPPDATFAFRLRLEMIDKREDAGLKLRLQICRTQTDDAISQTSHDDVMHRSRSHHRESLRIRNKGAGDVRSVRRHLSSIERLLRAPYARLGFIDQEVLPGIGDHDVTGRRYIRLRRIVARPFGASFTSRATRVCRWAGRSGQRPRPPARFS